MSIMYTYAGQIARPGNDLLSSSLSSTNSVLKNKKKNRRMFSKSIPIRAKGRLAYSS